MASSVTYQIGDWVRFAKPGELRIGVVEYTSEASGSPGDPMLYTTGGAVLASDVLEGRRLRLVPEPEPPKGGPV